MSPISNAGQGTPGVSSARDARSAPGTRIGRAAEAGVNTVRASQARAAHRRDARRNELAVARWLRELTRPR
jgi:hypothetical protein